MIPFLQVWAAAAAVVPGDDAHLASRHFNLKVEERRSRVVPVLHSASLNKLPNDVVLPPDEKDASPEPSLGPVTERYVIATRGADVVLECRDADNNYVHWRKQGGNPSNQARVATNV